MMVILPFLFFKTTIQFNNSDYFIFYVSTFFILFLFILPCLIIYLLFYSYDYPFAEKRRLRKLRLKLIKKLSDIDNFSDVDIKCLGIPGLTSDNLIKFHHDHSIFGLDERILVRYKLFVEFKDGKMLPIEFYMCFDVYKHIYHDDKIMSESEFVNQVYKLCQSYNYI